MEDLKEFDEEFENAKPAESGEVPDGRYLVEIAKMEIVRTKDGRYPMLKWRFRIIEGDHAERLLFKSSLIKSGDPITYLKRDLTTVGLGEFPLSELPDRIQGLIGRKLSVYKKPDKKGDSWIYLGKLVTEKAPF